MRAGSTDVTSGSHVADEPYLQPYVDLTQSSSVGEGRSRPGFFRGVATVVTKLFNIVNPNKVYFGQKDGMQCLVIKNLMNEMGYDNVELVIGDTVREPDGL